MFRARSATVTPLFNTLASGHPRKPTAADQVAFNIGWDHAHHGLVPPPELLLEGSPVRQGWLAAKALFGQRNLANTRPVRQWLGLRLQAWLRGIGFDLETLTPNYLAQIEVTHCPVTRHALGGPAGSADAAVVERLHPLADYSAGHVVVMSHSASQARAGCNADAALRFAKLAEQEGSVRGLNAPAWQRLATLISFVNPSTHLEAARSPLRVLPPNRLLVLGTAQGLQTLITRQLAAPGWSGRLRSLTETMEDAALRHDFVLFVGALAPRVLEWPTNQNKQAQRQALEDLWLDACVMRRWQHFVVQLGEARCAVLLQRAAGLKIAGVHRVEHDGEQASFNTRTGVAPRLSAENVAAAKVNAANVIAANAIAANAWAKQPPHAGRPKTRRSPSAPKFDATNQRPVSST